MTSMTSPLALARDETVTSNQLRCARGYHQSHSNHSHQPGQANRAARRNSGARALSSPLPFSILPTPFAAPRRLGRTNDIIMPKASEQSRALSPLRDMPCCACVCSTARYHHTSSRTISPSLQIAHVVSEHKSTSTSFETLVTKKPIVAITTFAHRDPTSKTTKRLRLAFCPLPKPVPSTLSTLRPVRLLRARPKNLRPFPRELGRIFRSRVHKSASQG